MTPDYAAACRAILDAIDDLPRNALRNEVIDHRDVLDALANGQLIAIPREIVEWGAEQLDRDLRYGIYNGDYAESIRDALRAALAATTPREATETRRGDPAESPLDSNAASSLRTVPARLAENGSSTTTPTLEATDA